MRFQSYSDMQQKKKRDVNWDAVEKTLLRELVSEYAIIENKTGVVHSAEAKKKAWIEVLKRFNLEAPKYRDLSQLKAQWKAMKIKAKKSICAYQASCMYGDGEGRPATPSQEDLMVRLMMPSDTEPDINKCDSNGSDHNYYSKVIDDAIVLEDAQILQEPEITEQHLDFDAAVKQEELEIQRLKKSHLRKIQEFEIEEHKLKLQEQELKVVEQKLKVAILRKQLQKYS